MPKKHSKGMESATDPLARTKDLELKVERLAEKLKKQESSMRALVNGLAKRVERESVVMEALGLNEKSKKGDRGLLNEISESILHMDEYLLRNSERIDTILVTLKNHRELLLKMSDTYFRAGERDRIKLELSVMRNTVSIMALAGIDMDISLLKEIKAMEVSLGATDMDIAELKKSKERLEKRFDGELKRFDVESIYLKRRDIPGYS